jgi:hypothetical protein
MAELQQRGHTFGENANRTYVRAPVWTNQAFRAVNRVALLPCKHHTHATHRAAHSGLPGDQQALATISVNGVEEKRFG